MDKKKAKKIINEKFMGCFPQFVNFQGHSWLESQDI